MVTKASPGIFSNNCSLVSVIISEGDLSLSAAFLKVDDNINVNKAALIP